MSLTLLLRDPQSPVRVYLDGISPLLEASGGRRSGSRAAGEALHLLSIARSRTVVSPFPGTDLPLSGTAFDFRARIELGGFSPNHSEAAAGIALLTKCAPDMENGIHRAKVLTEAFGIAKMLLREPSSESDLDRASILLAYCEQIARAGADVMNGSLGDSCDTAGDGKSFADQMDPLALADIRSLMLSNEDQLKAWQHQIVGGDRYKPNPGFAASALVGGADADWIMGDTLIDCKVYRSLTVPKLRDFVRQLLGYVLLDSDDSLGIRRVGIWLPRQMMMPSWSLTHLLGGDPEELLPSLRQGFIKATGKTQLAPHLPVSTTRKHQLLADNRHTPFERLSELALSEDVGIRWRVARNSVTPEGAIRVLAADAIWRVREGVAKNMAAPQDVLAVLALDRSAAVRRAVAANPGVPLPLVKALAADTDNGVRWAARTNDGVGNTMVDDVQISALQPTAGDQSAIQIRQNRDDSALDSVWFSKFLQSLLGWGYPRLAIPFASHRWGWQSGRRLEIEEWMRTGLPEEVLADLIREDRPGWVRRSIARDLPISDLTVRDGFLSDADPEIRYTTLYRTRHNLDQSLSALLADLTTSRDERLRFRTEGMGPRREWKKTAAEFQHEMLCLIASHLSTPNTALLTLTSSSSVEVLAKLIDNPSLGADDRDAVVQSLQTSKSVPARELLATLGSVPEIVLIDLASDKNIRVRVAVARHPAAPPIALSRLAMDNERTVRLAVLNNENTSGDLARSIAEAMLLSEVDEDLQEMLTLAEARADLDLPPQVIEGALDRLSKSRLHGLDMRVVVANDERSSEKTLSRLAQSAEGIVRQAVAINPRTPVVVLEQLARDPQPSVRSIVASNPLSPRIALMALSRDEDLHVRSKLAENPNLPESILQSLLNDVEANVRSSALRNPLAPMDSMHDAEIEIVPSGRRSGLDRATLVEMVANRRAEVRMEVAFNPSADVDLLVMLGGEPGSAQVRRAVAANPNAPTALLGLLADDKDEEVRQAVAFNGATPERLLAELASRSIDLAVLVAMNPDVPATVLEALAQDSNPLVRFVANGTRQSRVLPSDESTQKELDEIAE